MVMELDLNVTDPAANRRDVEQMIPHYCWMYLRHHSFQLNSTVFVNSTTFGIKVCSGCRELNQPRRLRQIKRHLKMNICAMMTIWLILLFIRILYCSQTTLKLD